MEKTRKSEIEKPKMRTKPPYQPTDQERVMVESAAGWGIPHEEIALLVNNGKGIDADTLKKHFKLELERGKAKAHTKIAQTLFQKAVDGDTTMLIWYTKTRMGWRETKNVAVTNPDGSLRPSHTLAGAVAAAKADLENDSGANE